ncbi:MAG: Txe/YoeB family addiction module toxin [Ignavibacteria bacterium]|nr:Txe/YoeB family addiction module toxin [Ignavibacteria bacterium]
MKWDVVFARQANKDAKKLLAAGLKPRTVELLAVLARDPFQNPPPYEKLVGDLSGTYSRRINIKHRLVYEVFTKKKTVRAAYVDTTSDQNSEQRTANSESTPKKALAEGACRSAYQADQNFEPIMWEHCAT